MVTLTPEVAESKVVHTIEAHELRNADVGLPIEVTTPVLTYAGFLARANVTKQFVGILLDRPDGPLTSVVVSTRWPVRVEPFPTIAVGDLVTHPRHDGRGQVVKITADTTGRRVYGVEWPGQPQVLWHSRPRLTKADG